METPEQLNAQLDAIKERSLGELALAYELMAEARLMADQAAVRARTAGAKWVEIGDTSGMSAQGAQQRGGKQDKAES